MLSSKERATTYHRVVAAVLHADGRVLLCQRRADLAWHPHVWDLPGGHVDSGETAAAALVRELAEELGIQVRTPDWSPIFSSEIGDDTHITIWAVSDWEGQVINGAPEEHEQIAWFSVNELQALDLADPAIADLCIAVLNDSGD